MSFRQDYEALRALAPETRCRVEDTHAGKWWPSYAVRALRHHETGCPPSLRQGRRCADCRRAASKGYLPPR